MPYYRTGRLEEDLMIVGGITLLAFSMFVFCLIIRRFFRPSVKKNRFGLASKQYDNNNFNEDSFDNFNAENSHVSILDTSTPI